MKALSVLSLAALAGAASRLEIRKSRSATL
jgi:hypothetical protein